MNWIESINRTPNSFTLNILNKIGERNQASLSMLSERITESKSKRIRIKTELQTWEPVASVLVWNALELSTYLPTDGHQIYRCIIDDVEYLVPAQVLIKALIRPIKFLAPFLFRPVGLELISLPLLDEPRPSVGFFVPVHRLFGSLRGINPGILAAISWLHCFPSANAMHHSIYQFACDGRLDLKLPLASITTTLHYVELAGKYIVTEMVVMSLEAQEKPFEFAAEHTQCMVFHESASTEWVKSPSTNASIPCRHKDWILSDSEWNIISKISEKRNYSKHSQRKIIDLILTKWGTGIAWKKLPFVDGITAPLVIYTYQEMLRDGRWQELLDTLKPLRENTTHKFL